MPCIKNKKVRSLILTRGRAGQNLTEVTGRLPENTVNWSIYRKVHADDAVTQGHIE